MSLSVAVIGGAYTNDDNTWRCLSESAEKRNVPLHIIGKGKGYPHLRVFEDLAILVESLPDDYILLTDTYDVMVNRWHQEEIIDRVKEADGDLFVSANDDCWPAGPWCESYQDNGTPWRTACAGQYVGTKSAILILWKEFLSGRWEQSAGGTTQEMMHRMHAGGYPFTVDVKCEVFQIMGHISQPYIFEVTGRAYNIRTGTYPMFLHFGGRAPGMEDWFRRLYGS